MAVEEKYGEQHRPHQATVKSKLLEKGDREVQRSVKVDRLRSFGESVDLLLILLQLQLLCPAIEDSPIDGQFISMDQTRLPRNKER